MTGRMPTPRNRARAVLIAATLVVASPLLARAQSARAPAQRGGILQRFFAGSKGSAPPATDDNLWRLPPVAPPRRAPEPMAARSATADPSRPARYAAAPNAAGPNAAGPQAGPRLSRLPPSPADPQYLPELRITSRLFEPARVIATVGDEHILVGDVLPMVNRMLDAQLEEMPEEARTKIEPEQLDEQRALLLRRILPHMIDNKLAYLDFQRTMRQKVPADKLDDQTKNMQKNLDAYFDKEGLPKAMKDYKVETPAQLNDKLKLYGSSIPKLKRMLAESELGRAAMAQHIERDPVITHQELLAYYQEHAQEYDIPAKARWEQLTVLFPRYPDKQSAYAAICEMGNRVLAGAAFAEVARAFSQEPDASEGGVHDWVSKGSLASEPLDRALFTERLRTMSPIIEDARGFHIIRVLERTEATRVPFEETQPEIRETIRKERMQHQLDDYSVRLRREIPVWTAFDDEPPLE